ncbi:hypothetical protein [Streptomyces hirsutus]|uniref:hypothetical protein n=1 Tax=Streptomyces hirsutus TaxID=35620 RepID=UPI0012FF227A|nr:hypothetical protein [Streptomyces hirsutus]
MPGKTEAHGGHDLQILVHSTANDAGRQAARDRRPAGAAADLDKLTAVAGGRRCVIREKTVTRIGVTATKRRIMSACAGPPPGTNRAPTLARHLGRDVLDAEAAVGSWYTLLTGVPALTATLASSKPVGHRTETVTRGVQVPTAWQGSPTGTREWTHESVPRRRRSAAHPEAG